MVYLGYYFKKQLSYFQSTPSNLSNCNIFQRNKAKIAKLGTKNALFWYSWAGIWICLDTKFGAKAKPLNLGPKMPDLSICCRLEIMLSYLKSEPSNLSNCKILWENENTWIRDKKRLNWVFLGWIFSTFKNQHLWISVIAEFCEIMKIPKFGNKIFWFG